MIITVQLPSGEVADIEVDDRFDALCEAMGLTRQEAVNAAIEWFCDQHPIIAQGKRARPS